MPPRLCMSKRKRFFQDLNPDADSLYPDDITLGTLLGQIKQRKTDLLLGGPSLSIQDVNDCSSHASAMDISEPPVGKRKAAFCDLEPVGESLLPKSIRPPKKPKTQVIPTRRYVSKRKHFFEDPQLDTDSLYPDNITLGSLLTQIKRRKKDLMLAGPSKTTTAPIVNFTPSGQSSYQKTRLGTLSLTKTVETILTFVFIVVLAFG